MGSRWAAASLGLAGAIVFLAGCGGDDPSAVRKGVEGATCTRTDDCEEPLQCIQAICVSVSGGQDASGGPGDAVFAPPDAVEDVVEAEDTALSFDHTPPSPDAVYEVLADFLGGEDGGEDDVTLVTPDTVSTDTGTIFQDCEGVGIASEWTGSFTGAVAYMLDFEIPGVDSEDELPVVGELSFTIQCIEQKLVVAGSMEGLALGAYPFTLDIAGSYNTETMELKALMKDGSVEIVPTVYALFEGTFEGVLTGPDAMQGTWDGYSTGTDPPGIPGTATGEGEWNAQPL